MSMLKPYHTILRNWNKSWGPKPTVSQLKCIKEAGWARPGSKTAFALAMLTREEGAAQTQIKEALGATYRNRANQLCMLGLAKLKQSKRNGTARYRLEVRVKHMPQPEQAGTEQHMSA